MKTIWLIDPKTKEPSVTLTMFVYGFVTATTKLLISGISILDKYKMGTFSGTEYATVVAALGGVYILKRHPSMITKETDTKDVD